MSVRSRIIYLLIIELGLVLLLVGVYPLALNELSNAGGDVGGLLILLVGLLLGIIGIPVVLYKVVRGKATYFTGFSNIQTELTVIRLIKKDLAFGIPALFSTAFPLLFLVSIVFVPAWLHIFPADIVKSVSAHINPILAVLLFVFSIIFVVVFLQILGLLITGELLQRRLTHGSHNFFTHMLKNVVFALPYTILYSLVFFLVLLARKKDKDRSALEEAARSTSILAGLHVLKYYIYANLSSVAFEDRYTYTTLKDSVQYVRSNAVSLFRVFTNSAVLSGVAFLYVFVLMVWADRTPFLSENFVMGLSFGLAAVVIAWMVFVEQVLFLLNYIRIRHPDRNIKSLVGDIQMGPEAFTPPVQASAQTADQATHVPTSMRRKLSSWAITLLLVAGIITAQLSANGMWITDLLPILRKSGAKESAFAAETYAVMTASQKSALDCLESGSDLQGRRSLWKRGIPQPGSAICNGQSAIWQSLPSGWKYTKVVDPDISDGTFAFGARSRSGELVGCGEQWCVSRNAERKITILSLTPGPLSAEVVLPESGNVRPDDEVEIARITVANSTEAPVDLVALWFKKSGTASDAAIGMIYIEDGDGTFGTSYMHILNSPYYSRNGMVYINQPEMFLVGPKQSRTYTVLITVSAEARSELGKTIGLDFVGFSYDPQVSGMPASGAIHTIR